MAVLQRTSHGKGVTTAQNLAVCRHCCAPAGAITRRAQRQGIMASQMNAAK